VSEHLTPDENQLVELIRSIDVEAPRALHERVEALVAERSRRQPQRRRRLLAAGAVAAAAAVIAIALIGTSSSSQHPPLVAGASALTLREGTVPAPAESNSHRGQLDAAVDGVAFPYWEESFGWRSTGARHDVVAGRPVTTVYYADAAGRRVGYAIVGGGPAPAMEGGSVQWVDGTAYRVLDLHGANAVVWKRSNRLCILAGRGVPATTLVRLASWVSPGVAA
jgi:hypothetical protein